MIKRRQRREKIDAVLLRRLWATRMTEVAIAARLGHSRNTVRRFATLKLGLPTSRRKLWAEDT